MIAITGGKLVFPDRISEGVLLMENGRILAAGDIPVPAGAEIVDATGLYVGPGLIDQHSHGYQRCGESLTLHAGPRAAANAHLKHGTTTYIPSTDYSESLAAHEDLIRQFVEILESGEETSIMGIHLEGPYINRRYGSMSLDAMDYDDETCEKLFAMASPYVRHCTYAPELPTATRLEERMRKYHIPPAIGHTCAGPGDIERAVAYGARIVTHLYDAMAHHKGFAEAARLTQHPQNCTGNILLSIPGLYYELICDSEGLHATPYSIREAYRVGGEDHIILISDSIVGEDDPMADRDVSYDITGGLCGSRLCVAAAMRNFVRFTGADIRVAFKCASTNSAKAMGLYDQVGSIDPGKLANIVLVTPDLHVKKVFFKGREIPEVRD